MATTALRTAVFIDGAHLTRSLHRGYAQAPNIAYAKLCELCTPTGSTLVGGYYYDALPYVGPGATARDLALAASKRRFFGALRHRKLIVREGRVARECNDDGSGVVYKQKFVDVLLATDLVLLAAKGQIDVAALVTGDSDFIPAVELAKAEGVHVRLVRPAWARNIHHDLIAAASELFILERATVENIRLPRAPANDNGFRSLGVTPGRGNR